MTRSMASYSKTGSSRVRASEGDGGWGQYTADKSAFAYSVTKNTSSKVVVPLLAWNARRFPRGSV